MECPMQVMSKLILSSILSAGIGSAWGDDFNIRVAMQEKSAATFYVPGDISGFGPVDLMVDTGSGYMTINEETLKVLMQHDAARYVKQLQGILADGSEIEVPVYSIERMRIGGDCWLTDIEAAVFPGNSRQILGLSALRKVAPFVFSVDPPGLSLSSCGSASVGALPQPALSPALTSTLN
jgi:predicted aspartyl protease